MVDDNVKELNAELNYPSAARLMKALKARCIPFNKAEIVNLAADDAVRQIQAAAPVAKGKIASDGLDVLWFADLIDFSPNPSKDFNTFWLYRTCLVGICGLDH